MSEVIKGIFSITNRIEKQYALITILFILTKIKKTIPTKLNGLIDTLYISNSMFKEILPNFTFNIFIELVSPVLILFISFSMIVFVPFMTLLIFINDRTEIHVTLNSRNLIANFFVMNLGIIPLNALIVINLVYFLMFDKMSSAFENIIEGKDISWYYLGIYLVIIIDILGLIGIIKTGVLEEK